MPPSGTRPVRGDTDRTVRDPKHDRGPVATDKQPKTDAKPEREKRNFFLFWRHAKKNPDSDLKGKVQPPKRCKSGENCATEPDLTSKLQPPKRCKAGEVCPQPCKSGENCPQVCEDGFYRDGSGRCESYCSPDQAWDPLTKGCSRRVACGDGEYWDGMTCVSKADPCDVVTGQGATLVNELRALNSRIQTACSQAASGSECIDLKQQHEGAMQRYRMLLKTTTPACRARLPDPLSL